MENINFDELSKEYAMSELAKKIHDTFKFIYLRLLLYIKKSY